MSSGTATKKPTASASQKFFQTVAPLSDLSAEKYGNPRPFSVDLQGVQHTNAHLYPRNANPYLLTVKQAAERLQLGVNCVYGLTKAEYDPIPTLTVGRSIRIPVAALERWLEAQTRG